MAMDRGILDKQLQALGESSSWWEQRELRDLPAVLHADEEIRALARGKLGRLRVPRRSWLLVVTDQRLICLRSGRTAWTQLEVNVRQITGVTLRILLLRGRLRVNTSDRTHRFVLSRLDAQKVVSALSSVAQCGQDTLSGPTHMVRRMVSHVLSLPAAVLAPQPVRAGSTSPTNAAVDPQQYHAMEEHIQELQRQIEFLEELLRKRQLQSSSPEPELQASADRTR